ncbi:uncharacterized protein FTOL_08151 [Fusarium torulosum]|uniref:Uncharacterized protein n=1 Tax=Fusarium torulosum TaxID=33205 RepID=A0AAE8MDH1_9HYPO|nr:uncharacterized protein FTOL_08151 [Fusarium torulosum]
MLCLTGTRVRRNQLANSARFTLLNSLPWPFFTLLHDLCNRYEAKQPSSSTERNRTKLLSEWSASPHPNHKSFVHRPAACLLVTYLIIVHFGLKFTGPAAESPGGIQSCTGKTDINS